MSLPSLLLLIPLVAPQASAPVDDHPLRPADTSSPRATLRSFLDDMEAAHRLELEARESYLASDRLYASDAEREKEKRSRWHLERALDCLDLSALPPGIVNDFPLEFPIYLKEVLDRVELPPWTSVPDAAGDEVQAWRLPGTHVDIVHVSQDGGVREFRFSAETVRDLARSYALAEDLPYRSTPWATPGLYERFRESPAGVLGIVPLKLQRSLPAWAREPRLGLAVWKWPVLVAALGGGLVLLTWIWRRIARRLAGSAKHRSKSWLRLVTPLLWILFAFFADWVATDALFLTGRVFWAVQLGATALLHLAAAWAAWVAGGVLAEGMISSGHLKPRSVDSQLVRLGLRVGAMVLATGIVMEGASRLGFHAYSILAGLGVGGLAVALAAKDSLANLLGSFVVMLERPFAIGDLVRVGDVEGWVEMVGFRSTRIRTVDNSLVSIPSGTIVNSVVDNMEKRRFRRVQTVLSIPYDTSPDDVEALAADLRGAIEAHDRTADYRLAVNFHDFGPSGLEIFVHFFVKVPDWQAEHAVRQELFAEFMRLAEARAIPFAFPTRTLHVASLPAPEEGGVLSPMSRPDAPSAPRHQDHPA